MRGIRQPRLRKLPRRTARRSLAVTALLACGGWMVAPVPASAAPAARLTHARPEARLAHAAPAGGGAQRAAAGSSAFDWPEFHRSTFLRGYAPNSTLSTNNAGHLGVAWATNLYGAALDSPVIAFDATLNQTLAYIGTEHGYLIAVDVATGQTVWSTWLGGAIRATPIVKAGYVYAGTVNSARVYKLNASTGAISCSVASPQPIEGTPVIASPPGGVSTLYVGTNDSIKGSGPTLAISTSNCKLEWSFTGFSETSGSWDAVAYAVDASHTPLIVFGSADPDARVYALNAVTGSKVWSFAVNNPPPGMFDIGAGVTVTPPSASDPDGTAYVPTKFGDMYALDLTTGKQLWDVNFNQALNTTEGGRSTAAIDGTNLVFGYNGGIANLDTSKSGAMTWHYLDPSGTEVLSSPAIVGPPGSEIVAAGDLAGGFDVVSLATGAQLYRYRTGGYITASPAVSDGNILVASSDGFLYDFAAGGGNEPTLPSTAVTSPPDFATLANPDGRLTVSGTAADAAGVGKVEVAVQEGGTNGQWWDAAASTWVSGPIGNPAHLASSGPGVTSGNWTFSYPVPPEGGTYTVTANTASTAGQSDIKGGHTRFSVLATTTGPSLASASRFAAPGASVRVSGAGFGPSEKVTISLAGTALTTVTTSASGAISGTKVVIPTKAAFGLTAFTAKGQTSGKTATAAITIANAWNQTGYGPAHTGFEPNDSTLFDLVHIGPDLFLDPAWQYQSGAAATSPAVAGAVAYTGNASGQLAAIDVHNGAPLWASTITSKAIGGSPAVDPANGLVFAGAGDGRLYAVTSAKGTPAWHTTLAGTSGSVSAPVFASGKVYATSSTGTVEAFSEATGTKSWARLLPGAISAAPALDAAAGTLVVTQQSGRVVGLSAATGNTLWAFTAGGAVAAPAAILGGTVYFGSADGSVYAISEQTGKKIWSHATGSPVACTPAVSNSGTPGGVLEVLIGAANGTLYALRASDGSQIFSVPFHHAITGVSAVRGVAIVSSSTGFLGGSRTYSDLRVWGFQTGGNVSTPPVIVDGTVYAGSADGKLYAFTTYGQLPDSAISPMR